MPSKKKSTTPSASRKLPEETAVTKNACASIENQENRVNCANSKTYNPNSTTSVTEIGSKDTECCENGTNRNGSFLICIHEQKNLINGTLIKNLN